MLDGSQARKTKDEKELILVRIERSGMPIYMVTSLLDMSNRGGGGADAIKLAIDSVFSEADGNVPLTKEDYRAKVVCATADGANVNLGIYNGVLTQMKNERPWLVTIHCVNHRLELAIKDAVKSVNSFAECDRFYTMIFYLLRNSGK